VTDNAENIRAAVEQRFAQVARSPDQGGDGVAVRVTSIDARLGKVTVALVP
jgi:hypothetical protein